MRGRRNEPAYLPHVLAKLAEIRGWTLAEAEARTEDAFFALFDRIPAAMTGALEVTILGCGSSGGVPRADGNWGACDPADPRNRRSRCSLLVRRPSRDGPGARRPRGGRHLAGVPPADRGGRRASGSTRCCSPTTTPTRPTASTTSAPSRCASDARMPCYMDAATRATLMRRFGYIFEGEGGYPAICDDHILPPHGAAWAIEGPSGAIPIVTFDQDHGGVRCVGYRFGTVAYSSDVVGLAASRRSRRSAGVKRVDRRRACATRRIRPTRTRADAGLDRAGQARARHPDQPAHRPGFQSLSRAELPAGVEPAYDGMRFVAPCAA